MTAAKIDAFARACEAVIRETAHQMNCRCDCRATDAFKEARAEFYRLWRKRGVAPA